MLVHPRGGGCAAMVLPPGHFAATCGCGMVGGCRQPDAPAGTPGSGPHLCTLCDRRVVKFSIATTSNTMQPASAEEARFNSVLDNGVGGPTQMPPPSWLSLRCEGDAVGYFAPSCCGNVRRPVYGKLHYN